MTVLAWDQVGDRRYEAGVDRGVLYPPDAPGVAWNGLTGVQETGEPEIKPYYHDGMKFLEHKVIGDFAARLQAFTYPDELEDLLGVVEYAPGVFLHQQRGKSFGLSYRTGIGNDLEGLEHGYRIHLMYNLRAAASGSAISTTSESNEVSPLEWTLTSVPPIFGGIRPTAHLSVNTRLMAPSLVSTIENLLYGTAGTDPTLPDIPDLLALIQDFYDG